METTVVPNNFPKTNIFVTILFISVKIGFNTFFVVAMVTKFNSVLQTLTFICFNLHSSMCSNKHKYQELFYFLHMPFSVFTTEANFYELSVLWWH